LIAGIHIAMLAAGAFAKPALLASLAYPGTLWTSIIIIELHLVASFLVMRFPIS
jgi:hypothetical protein